MNYFFSCSLVFLVAGVYLQEISHFIMNSYIESLYITRKTRLLICFGVIFEFFSIAQLPLCTYVVLSSLHILVFKHVLIKDEKRSLTPAENLGSIAILSGCIVISLFGPEQGEIVSEELNELFDPYYYIYTISSLGFTLFLRRQGFFSGRILIETGLVSQINSLGICALKVLWIQLHSNQVRKGFYIMVCMIITFTATFLSNSFIRVFLITHDLVIVMGGYFMWSLFYCLPLGFFFSTGIKFSVLNLSALMFGSCLVVSGVYFHSFTKIEYLKAYRESKLNKVPEFIV